VSPVAREKAKGPTLTVADLCNFVRSHFGADAASIAQRHVDAYSDRALYDIAATWAAVRDQLEKERKTARAA
jgi:hypothetical protein